MTATQPSRSGEGDVAALARCLRAEAAAWGPVSRTASVLPADGRVGESGPVTRPPCPQRAPGAEAHTAVPPGLCRAALPPLPRDGDFLPVAKRQTAFEGVTRGLRAPQ